MINHYAHERDRFLGSLPFVINHEFCLVHLSPSSSCFEGSANFTDGSRLYFFEFLRMSGTKIERNKYRYHYLSDKGKLVFRYDNAPHYPKISSHPHHKHLLEKVEESKGPGFIEVLNEIKDVLLGV